ncbi:transcriptional regulation of mitochondrial recombination-domain-containing protein [Clohesyomyces aquaticus]|uniref:Large ribosomal subunit protein mL67 n=1 Tax=Clohesyomyces aquaticus TaxID=1231657 RepID=A0A1Y1Y350_9PLEO|nr:transcriptional regulation of mitochondrial recombination-domain-containing protein [Clohesyomyces aquaticus]
MPPYKWVKPVIPEVATVVTRPAIRPAIADGATQHGRHVFIWQNTQTNQILYSFDPELKDSHLNQLPFIGKKSVPASIRPDLWRQYCTITLPTPEQGLYTYRKLREYTRLHYLGWDPKKTKRWAEESENSGGSEKSLRWYQNIKHPEGEDHKNMNLKEDPAAARAEYRFPERKKALTLMNQSRNVVEDLARVLFLQKERASEMQSEIETRKELQKEVFTNRLKKVKAMAKEVEEGAIPKFENRIADAKVSQSRKSQYRRRIRKLLWAQRQFVAYNEAQQALEKVADIDKELGGLKKKEAELIEQENQLEKEKLAQLQLLAEVKAGLSLVFRRYEARFALYRKEAWENNDDEATRAEVDAELTEMTKELDRLEKLRERVELDLWRLKRLSEHSRWDQKLLNSMFPPPPPPEEQKSAEGPQKDQKYEKSIPPQLLEYQRELFLREKQKLLLEKEKLSLEEKKLKWWEARQRRSELLAMEKDLPNSQVLPEDLQKELLELQNRDLEPSLWNRKLRWEGMLQRRTYLLKQKAQLPKGRKLPGDLQRELDILMARPAPGRPEWDSQLEIRLLKLSQTELPKRLKVHHELTEVQERISELGLQRESLLGVIPAQDQLHEDLLNPVARSLVPEYLIKPLPTPFDLNGVVLEWADLNDSQIAWDWPNEVQQEHLGVTRQDRSANPRVTGFAAQFPRTEDELLQPLLKDAPNVQDEYIRPVRNMPEVEEKEKEEQPRPQKAGIWKYLPTFQSRFARAATP